MFALTFGIIYVVVALVEILFFRDASPETAFLLFNLNHNIVHWVAGVLGLVAYSMGESVSRMYAQVFGIVFLLVAILGFIPATNEGFLNSILGYPVNLLYSVVHLVTGVLGLMAGFGAASSMDMDKKA
jgi:hypothetical protein